MNYRLKPKKFNPDKHTMPKFAQRKMDGHRYYMDAEGVFTSHDIDVTAKVEHYSWFDKMAKAVDGRFEIEFEICSPGNPAEHVPTALKHGLPTVAWCFATNALPKAVPSDEVGYFFELYGLQSPCAVACLNYEELLDVAKKNGWEGFVLKDGNYLNWYKLKPYSEIDLIVTDWKPAKEGSKYDGMVGSLECRTSEGYLLANVSGMTDDIRQEMSENTDSLLGRIVEVRYERLGSRGKLRFPQFSRWRTDKHVDECRVSQDPKIEEYYGD